MTKITYGGGRYDHDTPAQVPVRNLTMYLLIHNGNLSFFMTKNAEEAKKMKISPKDHLFVKVRE